MSYREGYDIRKWHAHEMKRRPRRYWVRWGLVAGLASVMAIPVFAMIGAGDHGGIVPNVMPFSMLLFVTSIGSPFTREAWLSPRGFATYDEFERAALSDAMRRAYLIDILAIVGLFAWLMIASRLGWPVPATFSQWGAIGYALLMTMLTLPIVFAEFMVPMPDAEDEPL